MRAFWSFCRNLFRRDDLERAMADELTFHIDARAADLAAQRGIPHDEAMRLARMEFGSIERYKEEGRASHGLRLVDELRSDLRFAWRTLARNPGFFAAAVAILALGIGANTAVFSVVDAMLLSPLPVSRPGELVAFDTLSDRGAMIASYSGNGRRGPGGTIRRTSFSALTFDRLRERSRTLSHVFAFAPLDSVTVVADGAADRASAQLVSGDYYDGLGVAAVRGRTLRPFDDRPSAAPAAVVSYRYWQRRFLGDPGIVGKVITVNRMAFTVVGVTPRAFHGTEVSEDVEVTLPLAVAAQVGAPNGQLRPASSWWLLIMGRLAPGATRDQVLAELRPVFEDTVAASWAARPPGTRNPERRGVPVLRVQPGAQGPNGPSASARNNLGFLFAVTGIVLLIACVNVASLLLVRAANRQQEMALRRALGATRGRLIRQLLSESLLLAAMGAAAGLAVALWGKNALPRMFEADVVLDTAIDLRAIAFAAGLTTLTSLVFGIGHALRATRIDPLPGLKTTAGAPSARRAPIVRTLIGVQLAASLAVLVIAGLLVRTLVNYSRVDVGFDPGRMMVFRIDPGPSSAGAAPVLDVYERLASAVQSVPGVQSVTLSAMPVLAQSAWTDSVRAVPAGATHDVYIQAVRWNFFNTMGMPLVAGRSLQPSDTIGTSAVAVISEGMARQMFGGSDPIGRYLAFVNGSDRDMPIQVVGVVRDAKYSSLSEPAPPTLFRPYTQVAGRAMTVEVRTKGDPLALTSSVRAAIGRVDASLPLIAMQTEEQQMADTIRGPRTFSLLTTASAAIGLLLACVGLYGVVSYDAKRRTAEIGVRLALGARRADVVRLIMSQTVWMVTGGALVGLVVAVPASRLIANQLFGVQPSDPSTVVVAVAVLTAVACLAGYMPARRAARLDPTRALRYE
jgi:predicted permease